MLAGTTIATVKHALRHDRPTTWRELYTTLFTFGVVCAPDLTPVFTPDALPEVAVLMIPGGSPLARHWIIKYGDEVYDPARGVYDLWSIPFVAAPATAVVRYASVWNKTVPTT
jgi:hypothetical protein